MGRVQKNVLISHPDVGAPDLSLGCKLTLVGSDVLKIEYVVIGAIDALQLPAAEEPERQDGLWRHTCFEAFLALDGDAYVELNFSPSRHYASYSFEKYREGMQPALELPPPSIYLDRSDTRLTLTAWVDLKPFAGKISGRIGLSAVIETEDGAKSYWALAHALGPPDFHNADCFIATLPAPTAA